MDSKLTQWLEKGNPNTVSKAANPKAGLINYEFSLAQSLALAYDVDAAIFNKIISEVVSAIQRIRL